MLGKDVPSGTRVTQVACAILWCLLCGGPIFGFAALKPILVNEHVYEYVCNVSINSTDSTDTSNSFIQYFAMDPNKFGSLTALILSKSGKSLEAKCTDQDLKLNMMFTVGAMLTNVAALVIGRLLDIYGPRFCGLVGAGFLYIACVVFIFAKDVESLGLDPYLLGYATMALGGPFCYISTFQLSNSFPQKSGTILALLTGAFDASSAVFLIYKIIYTKTEGSFTIAKFFQVYLAVPVFISVVQLFLMPKESYKTNPEITLCNDDVPEEIPHATHSHPEVTEETALLHGPGRRDSIGDALIQPYADEGEASLIKYSGGIFGILHGFSAEYQIKTPWFYLMCAFATIQMLRLNYFVATISTQYAYLFHSLTKAEELTHYFNIALPLGGVLSIPFVGIFLDFCTTTVVLNTLLAISLLIGVLGISGNVVAGFINVSIFVAYRPFFYTAVSDFCAKVFGFDTFGTVYGAIICTSGVFNFLQSVLDRLTHTTFKMNPIPINIVLICITALIGGITLGYVKHQTKLYVEKKTRQLNA